MPVPLCFQEQTFHGLGYRKFLVTLMRHQQTPAYVSIRQHKSAYKLSVARIRQRNRSGQRQKVLEGAEGG
jgi:hypothetical protein